MDAEVADYGTAAAVNAAAGAEWRDFWALLKPRVVSLVVFTGAVGMFLAPTHLNPVIAFTAILSIALGAGAAGCLNMWWERDLDGKMRRTASRPIPMGRVEPGEALAFGLTLAAFSVVLLGLATNFLAALLLATSIFYYAVIYTMWLKPRTVQNIVVGGGSGAFPPVIGWAAATGHIGLLPVLLFALVFFWTPPHFWSLSLYACKDYARAGIPMLPVISGARETRRQIFLYTLVLAVFAILPWALHLTGAVYGVTAVLMSAGFAGFAFRVLRDRTDAAGVSLTDDKPARQAFRFSLAYLTILFVALGLDHILLGSNL
jgi:protoheme IX farnesyltransferase